MIGAETTTKKETNVCSLPSLSSLSFCRRCSLSSSSSAVSSRSPSYDDAPRLPFVVVFVVNVCDVRFRISFAFKTVVAAWKRTIIAVFAAWRSIVGAFVEAFGVAAVKFILVTFQCCVDARPPGVIGAVRALPVDVAPPSVAAATARAHPIALPALAAAAVSERMRFDGDKDDDNVCAICTERMS